ncbi:TonB-dependent receptor domain-containing protein [Shewanella sp. A14]
MRFRPTPLPAVFVGILSLSTSMALLPLTAHAQTQSQAIHIQVSSGSLEQALNSLGQQTGIILVFSSDLTKGLNSKGLAGTYTVHQALTALLKGTDIQFTVEGGTATLVKANSSDVMMLAPVRISGSGFTDSTPVLGNVTSISYDELKRSQPNDLKEVFAKEAAVVVGGSIPMNQKLYLRGVEETALSVTIDGARQNNKVFHHSAATLIDPSLLKSARASSGVSPADDGPGAIGGSIVFETVDVADLLEKDDPFGGFANVGYSSNSKTLSTAASVYGQQDGFEALAFVNRANGDDYKDGNGDTVKYSEADLLSGLAKVAYQAESGDRFELSYESVNDDAVRPYRANIGQITAGRPTPESRQYDLSRTNIVFNYNHQTESGLWNPKVVIANSETELVTTEVPLAAPTTTIVYTGKTESQSLVAQNLFVTDFADITAGVDYYDDSTTFLTGEADDLVEKVDNIGVFAQFRHELSQLSLSYGVRYDQQDFTGVDNSTLDDSGISANIFAEYAATEHLILKAGYASVWAGIALGENFIFNPGWDYSEGIKPIESDNFVVGFESNIRDVSFGANVYETEISNGRTPSYGGGPGLVSDFDISGHDIFIHYETPSNTLSLQYSNIKADKDGQPATSYDGNYFTSPLGELITISGTTFFTNLPLTMGFNAEISLDNDAVASNGSKQEGYTVINVHAEYQALEGLNVRLAVNNLFDEAYVDRGTYGQEFLTINSLLESGRAITLSARYEF